MKIIPFYQKKKLSWWVLSQTTPTPVTTNKKQFNKSGYNKLDKTSCY